MSINRDAFDAAANVLVIIAVGLLDLVAIAFCAIVFSTAIYALGRWGAQLIGVY